MVSHCARHYLLSSQQAQKVLNSQSICALCLLDRFTRYFAGRDAASWMQRAGGNPLNPLA